MIVTIDGPSGTGKSTTAKALAKALKIPHFDSGALYRAFTLHCLNAGIDIHNPREVEGQLDTFIFEPTDAIRSEAVTKAVSAIAEVPSVRTRFLPLQRDYGAKHGGVFEGRDMGTVVFPNADHKIYLTARPEVRAQRRHKDRPELSVQEILDDQKRRDTHDSERETAPLKPADDAYILDTSDMTLDQVVQHLVEKIHA